jgi:hypothetical protein
MVVVKKCKFCAEEIQDDAIICKHCQRDVTKKKKAVVYFRRPNCQPDYAFISVSAPTLEEIQSYKEENKSYIECSLQDVINNLTARGWSVQSKSDNYITFSKSISNFNIIACLLLLLFFVVPAIVYAIVTAQPQVKTQTFEIAL